jgi:hypothetical protein
MDREREAQDALNGLRRLPTAIATLRAVMAKAFGADRAAEAAVRFRGSWTAADGQSPTWPTPAGSP